jgi:sarcosine oxidase
LKAAVIGVGTMGAQVLWQLSRRGVDVTGFERYAPGHSRGAAGGENRLFRNIELEDTRYSPIVSRAGRLWEELQEESGCELRTLTGSLVMGSQEDASMRTALRSAEKTGIDYEVLHAEQLAVRCPQFRMYDGDLAILDVRGGFIRPELTVATTARLAQRCGAKLVTDSTVLDVRGTPTGAIIKTDRGEHHFDRAIVCAGGWTAKLLPQFARIVETRRQYRRGILGQILDTWLAFSLSSEPSRRTAMAFPPPTTRP